MFQLRICLYHFLIIDFFYKLTFGASDGLTYDVFPQSASCKCYFFDNMAELSNTQVDNSSDWRFNDVLRRRFFRQGYDPASFIWCLILVRIF